METNSTEEKRERSFFSLREKYTVAILLGLIAGIIAEFTVGSSEESAIVILLFFLLPALGYAIYSEIKTNSEMLKRILGVLLALLITPIVFSLAFRLGSAMLKSIMQ